MHDPYAPDVGFLGIGKAFKSAAKAVGNAAKGAVKGSASVVRAGSKVVGSGINTATSTLGKVPVVGSGLKGFSTLALSPYSLAASIGSGQRIDRAVIGNFKQRIGAVKDIAPYVQTVISVVPGIGTGISGAISASLALAEGRPITEVVLAAAKGALPGGPLAAAAFDAAVAAAQGKPISDIALAAVPLPPAQKEILRQSLAVAKDVAAGKSVSSVVLNRVEDNLKRLPPAVQTAAQVGVALGRGKSIQEAGASAAKGLVMTPVIKAVSNLGMTKSAIQQATGAAQAIRNGSPALQKTLKAAVSNFRSGSPEHLGFVTAVKVLGQTSGNQAAMGIARRALPNDAARAGFDTAVGTISRTVTANPGALAKRAGSIFVPTVVKAKQAISPYQPNLKHAIDALTRNPTLATKHPMVLAAQFGTSQQVVLDALKRVGTKRLLPWRSMSPQGAGFVSKWARFAPARALSFGTRDTAGLDESGTKYIVEKGDSPWAIAQKLTGNGNRWKELLPVNTDKKPSVDKNVWVGEVLNLPSSWQKPVAAPAPSPGPAVSSQPLPTAPSAPSNSPAPQISVAPGVLQAKSILVAWGKTDGVNQAGVTDYGERVEDMSTEFGPRDSLQLQSFQNWNNKSAANTKLDVDGKLGPKSLAALQSWAEERAKASIPAPVTVTVPEIVIAEPAPVPTPVVSAPSLPAPPTVTVALPAPSPAPSPVPAVATPQQPATPETVAATSPGGSMAPVVAGAIAGGTLFGLPGAIIGGIAGAAIA